MTGKPEFETDIEALGTVLNALAKLEPSAQHWVLSTAAGRLNVSGPAASIGTPSVTNPTGIVKPMATNLEQLPPKEFMRQKAPKSDVDRVACLAFYLTNARQMSSYSSREITAMNTEAAGPKFNVSRAVDNATKQSGYLTSAGKGKKQITSYGEDVVSALPDYEAVKALANTKAIRKKSNKRKGK